MRSHVFALFLGFSSFAAAADRAPTDAALQRTFTGTVRPFVEAYCVSCHGADKPEAELDLSRFNSVDAVAKDFEHWKLVLEKLQEAEMPPAKAKKHPTEAQRKEVVAWLQAFRQAETKKHAGDPGTVLARRLSNSEYNYTIRDLTGVDIRPTREFPVDPSNTEGFDNSGESLAMTPSLLDKYLKAAREVANHMFLEPQGFRFAPHPMIVETDRDKYTVHQIIDFYHRQNMDYADYFHAAWVFKNRAALGKPKATLADIAAERKVSAKYLATVLATLDTREEVGPLAKLQEQWRGLPAPTSADLAVARPGCEAMRAYVKTVRAKVEPRFPNITAGRIDGGSPIMMIWKNVQYATHRMTFDATQLQEEGQPMTPTLDVSNEPAAAGEFGPGRTVPVVNVPNDPDLAVPAGQRARYEAAWAKFCRVFPDKFVMEERGRNYFNTKIDRGRYLSAGFHSNMGYFRDDQPLYELILDAQQQKELDAMWVNMDFVSNATSRQYVETNPGRVRRFGAAAAAADEPPPQAAPMSSAQALELTSEVKVTQAHDNVLAQAKASNSDERGLKAIDDYFAWMNGTLRATEKARRDAEPKHLEALLKFAERAYRHPLTAEDKNELLTFYRDARQKDGLDHEAAMRESIVNVLMAPDLTYRIDLAQAGPGVHPLSDYDLASRLSYFLWSSAPDAELLAQASAGKLHDPKVITAQAHRMLKDPRARALAVEFGGNWLDIRRFENLGSVDVERFPTFTNELKDAMFEEPVRFMLDVFQSDRPVLDLVYGKHTFVNPVLAKHYGMTVAATKNDEWVRVDDADRYQRGGLLPMAAFLTKNAPGLRTSPVKRGNWVVKQLLGERIPAPPPNVPVLPTDESKLDLPLRDMLARHREDPNCAACHARFDSYGLVFEGFGPIGERREKDLAGRPVDTRASFPGGGEGAGIEGLRKQIHDRREGDFIETLSRKLLVFALGRSPILSDELLIDEMKAKLAANNYRFVTLVDAIVTSPQFLNKRGRDDLAAK